MVMLLYLIPLLAIVSGVYIYRHNGRQQLLNLDMVQFTYTFILAPLFFVWSKTFLFFLLRSELGVTLSQGELFTIDTAFSVFFMYLYAFMVMHSLTKTFRLNTERDPLYDVFHHSEYIHLWLTHLMVNTGVMILFVALALVNLLFPVQWQLNKAGFYAVCGMGIVFGTIGFLGLLLTDPRQEGRRYMRLMKLAIGCCFTVLASAYLWLDPNYNASYGLYWFLLFAFATMTVWSFFTYRSARVRRLFNRLTVRSKDTDSWGVNPQLFTSAKKG